MQGGGSELARGEYFELVGAALRELDCAVFRGVLRESGDEGLGVDQRQG